MLIFTPNIVCIYYICMYVSIHPSKIPSLTHCLWECKIVQVLWKTESYTKLEVEVIISLSNSTSRYNTHND